MLGAFDLTSVRIKVLESSQTFKDKDLGKFLSAESIRCLIYNWDSSKYFRVSLIFR